jgi:hypothetical protein
MPLSFGMKASKMPGHSLVPPVKFKTLQTKDCSKVQSFNGALDGNFHVSGILETPK